ncbi:MAG TPA: TolC family protein [Bryobacteraceae bacterium]|nr:TolC family protein [Bryobacteraceae bacterium]
MRHSRFLAALWLVAACRAQTPPPAQTAAPPALKLTLKDALDRARQFGPQFLQANIAAQLARETALQAKAALLPTAIGFSQFIYTQPNGTPSGIFVSNDGPHVYNDQAIVHGDIWAPGKRADYRGALAAEAVARARMDVAARGLYATVAQDYYAMAVAGRKIVNAQQALREAQDFMGITQKLEQGGEAAHSDVIKAQIQLEQRQRDLQDAQLTLDKARIGFAILLFPDFRQDFTIDDDLETVQPLPVFPEMQALAGRNNPDIRAAQATVQQQQYAIESARWAMYPSLSFDYFFGLNANQFALHNYNGQNNLGSVAQAQLNVPIWTWGAARSKVRQAELQLQQARNDLSFTQRQLLSELQSFYEEAQVAASQVDSLRRSMEQSIESLRLTELRYRAGEVTVLEVVDAQSTLVLARNAFADGLARYRLALANLQTLTGVF